MFRLNKRLRTEINIALFREYQISKSVQHEMVTGGPCLALIKDLLSGWDYENCENRNHVFVDMNN